MKYVGSKNRFSKELVPIIQSYIDDNNIENYIEPFVGGANVIDKIKCKNRIGFDNHKELIALLQQAQDDTSVFPSTISEDEYLRVRNNKSEYPDWYVGLVGFCASFGAKYFGGYARDPKTGRNMPRESIQNILKQAPALKGITFANCDFMEIGNVEGCLIYCDPPYRGTVKYRTGNFQYEKFYDWCRKMSKSNIVLVSEYDMPDDFVCIWQRQTKTHLNSKRIGTENNRIEKLYIISSQS